MHISTKCSVAIHCLLFIHERSAQKKVTSELLSLSTGCNPVTVRSILSALKKDGVIEVKPGIGGATLCCPLEEISLYRVCAALEPDFAQKLIGLHPQPSQQCPIGQDIYRVLGNSYGKIREDLQASLGAITMADIVADYHRPHKEEA